jgi:hypothetical protein
MRRLKNEKAVPLTYPILNNTTELMGVSQTLQNLPEPKKCGFVKECVCIFCVLKLNECRCADSVRILNECAFAKL